MNADMVGEIFGQLSSEGWGGIDVKPDQLQRDVQKMVAEAYEEAIPVAATFSTPAGQKTLLWLLRKTIFRPPSDQQNNASTAEALAMQAARRDGQNAIVFMILHALQVANGEQSKGGDL